MVMQPLQQPVTSLTMLAEAQSVLTERTYA
jgi:hypothetical protein